MQHNIHKDMQYYQQQLSCPKSFPWQYIHIFATDNHIIMANYASEPLTEQRENALTALGKQQLTDYFAGQLTQFSLPLFQQASAFSGNVYQQLLEIPYGETVSYQHIAQAIAAPNSMRAVGRACGSNDISIIVPCHRVISASGNLTGYGGGLASKAWLLQHEQQVLKNKKPS